MSKKMDLRNRRLIAAALMLAIALAGCTASSGIERGVTWVNPGEQLIVSTTAGFKTTRPTRVKYADSWQTEEYALFRSEGRQSEIVYAEANRTLTVALDYQMTIEEMAATWNLNSRQNLVWKPLRRIDAPFETWFYRIYEMSDLQRSCVGFMVEWDQVYEDPRGRPGKVLFGYFCGARGETLKAQEVRALIRGISVRIPGESTEKKKTEPLDNDGSGKPAIDAARGYGPSVDSGNSGFPFRFARYYSVSGGGKMP
jgi:hypothetical protein